MYLSKKELDYLLFFFEDNKKFYKYLKNIILLNNELVENIENENKTVKNLEELLNKITETNIYDIESNFEKIGYTSNHYNKHLLIYHINTYEQSIYLYFSKLDLNKIDSDKIFLLYDKLRDIKHLNIEHYVSFIKDKKYLYEIINEKKYLKSDRNILIKIICSLAYNDLFNLKEIEEIINTSFYRNKKEKENDQYQLILNRYILNNFKFRKTETNEESKIKNNYLLELGLSYNKDILDNKKLIEIEGLIDNFFEKQSDFFISNGLTFNSLFLDKYKNYYMLDDYEQDLLLIDIYYHSYNTYRLISLDFLDNNNEDLLQNYEKELLEKLFDNNKYSIEDCLKICKEYHIPNILWKNFYERKVLKENTNSIHSINTEKKTNKI